MTPELGQLALILALLLALAQSILPIVGAWKNNSAMMAVARPAAFGQGFFVVMAFVLLVWAFLHFDFSVQYVADNSNLALPWYYRITAVWGAHEGSMLLWIFILNVWTLALALFSRQLPEVFAARVLGVLGIISVGFLAFILFTSDPFGRLLPMSACTRLIASNRSRIFAIPASAQTSSLAPPGDPPTPSAATISPLCLIATAPASARTLGSAVNAGPGPSEFLASSAI